MLLGLDLFPVQQLSLFQPWQALFILIIRAVIAAFLINLDEAVEGQNRTGCTQLGRACVHVDIDADLVKNRSRHLTGDGPLPDQRVEPQLILIEHVGNVVRLAREQGWADGLVGLLRVLGLGFIEARVFGHVGRAVVAGDQVPGAIQRFLGQLNAVGPHVGDQTHGLAADFHAFVEFLRHAHGVGGGEPELAAGFLLQGRSGERR